MGSSLALRPLRMRSANRTVPDAFDLTNVVIASDQSELRLLAIVAIFCFRLGANLPTTALILFGCLRAALLDRQLGAPAGLAAAANSYIMAPEPIGGWA
jgi:hypothetical protein